MSWTASGDLRAQLMRLWDRGEVLRAVVGEGIVFPLRLTLKTPSASDVSERFDAVRAWAADLAATPRVRIESREWRHRVQGAQQLPDEAWIDTLDDALAWTGKTPEARRFRLQWDEAAASLPAVLPWLRKQPLKALELAERWSRLLAVVRWVVAHPRPGIYLRQVDVPGVDSKFIEQHRGVLADLLDLALPSGQIDASATGVAQFSRRYGFLEKPARLRFRLLDATLPSLPGIIGTSDITLDAESFRQLALPLKRVFITENETNFLAFPDVAQSIAIFGAGYGWEALAGARWLESCAMHYWGDIDTHGYAILDGLRKHFPHVASFLMDRATLDAHAEAWGVEERPSSAALVRLNAEEAALYADLRENRIRAGLRLEQERIGFAWVQEALRRVVGIA